MTVTFTIEIPRINGKGPFLEFNEIINLGKLFKGRKGLVRSVSTSIHPIYGAGHHPVGFGANHEKSVHIDVIA